MKRKLLFGIAACITAVVAVAITLNVNVSTKSSDLSDIALANVEALARSEDGCSCYGPKIDIWNMAWCSCSNEKCCKDIYGCD